MKVKAHHPLQELIAQFLSGLEIVGSKEQRRMVNRACREAVKWHEEKVKSMDGLLQGCKIAIECFGDEEGDMAALALADIRDYIASATSETVSSKNEILADGKPRYLPLWCTGCGKDGNKCICLSG